ncbi:transcription termination/antitermination NusG family protein [Desulfonatronospira sp.]|uniref:transcription termination/antitermination NusG family protein n=1 Tax=Desulfonatronospira sp. TaxID=1962951 RepID=UPI0025C063D5|nr:transcription termination/antitermination NusG family protein [Desulfonatronospira sp.]
MSISLDKNPPQLHPENILSNASLPGQWRIARTKSRREKILAEFLVHSDIGYYLPMIKKRQPGQKRVRYSLAPIFSGYLFFKASDLQRHQAFKSNHIAGVIDIVDEMQLLKDLEQVQRAISLDAPVYPYDFVRKGDVVLIRKGPFAGLQGVIQRKNSSFRLVLNVKSLFQAVALDIEAHYVEPLGPVQLARN